MPLCHTTLISNQGYQESAVVLCEGFESDHLDFVKAAKQELAKHWVQWAVTFFKQWASDISAYFWSLLANSDGKKPRRTNDSLNTASSKCKSNMGFLLENSIPQHGNEETSVGFHNLNMFLVSIYSGPSSTI